jgi:hypothetical protein
MPVGARILHFGSQNNRFYIWALVNTDNPETERYFIIAVTGRETEAKELQYIGTAMLNSGAFVAHLFEA